MNTDKTISVDASADGKRNAYTVRCEIVMHSKAYAACLHLCSRRKQGRLDTQYADCSAAIGKKACPALKMRADELAAGHAIYFEERVRVQSASSFIDKAKNFVGSLVSALIPAEPEVSKSKPEPKTKPKSAVSAALDVKGGLDFAAALNTATAAPAAPAAPKVAGKIEMRPGESLLEAARRALQQSK